MTVNIMTNNRHPLYFTMAVVVILATGGFVALEVTDTMTDLALVEDSLYAVVRNGDARLSAEISRKMEEVDLNRLEGEFKDIDTDINEL